MAIVSDEVRSQLRERFTETLTGPVELRLRVSPPLGGLYVPGVASCETCEPAREISEALAGASSLVSLQITEDRSLSAPVLEIAAPRSEARVTFEGLPSGYEFGALLDAVERVSTADPGLSQATTDALAGLEQDVELMVFVTPT